MSAPGFVHLHVHTEYSLVDSTVRIPALMNQCAERGMPAVALTDQNNLFGLVKFYRKAIAAGVKPVIGLDLRILNEDEPDGRTRCCCWCRTMTAIAICRSW